MPALRMIVRWSATALALAGWLMALEVGMAHGHAAGVHTGFITALSVGITFTIVAGQWWLIPTRSELKEDQTVYALGLRHGLGCGACPLRTTPKEPSRGPLGVVR